MTRCLLLCAVLTGCGRLQFDSADAATPGTTDSSTPDAIVCVSPIGHDEDGDSIDDACDVCPAHLDDQRDTDGDKVGDACDPQPTATERIAMFDPFTEVTTLWRYGSLAVVGNDVLRVDALGTGTSPELVAPPARERFIAIGSIETFDGASHQFSIQILSTSTAAYYCELYQDADSFYIATTRYDGASYFPLAKQTIASNFANGPFAMTFDHFAPNIGCSAVWQGTTYTLPSVPIPSGISADLAQLAINRANVVVTSFTRIASTPDS